jgi:7,8-dihydropterin-6-yl-methyl-4-(beta-D-ribofuranosyl)aminobenzene 5'-phosphate synthase
MGEMVALAPVDALEVTVLVDNTMDVLMASSAVAHRAPVRVDTFEHPPLLAEHGYSLLITTHTGNRSETILYDAGLGKETIAHNMDVLGVNPATIRAIVLSHGHTDHHGGLVGIVQRIGRQRVPLVLHPDVWRDRKGVFPDGNELHLPPPTRADLEREGIEVLERRDPSLLIDDTVLITGQVERTTEFEKGMPRHLSRSGDTWEPDEWIWDDQAVVIHVKDRGLVVLSGCSHAGIVNVLRYGQKLTGLEKIHGVAGGFHLSGGYFEQVIPPTVESLAAIGPEVVMPGHCTGWKAIQTIAQRLPDAYVPTCVGTRLHFASPGAEQG